jgi:hypothetical protein
MIPKGYSSSVIQISVVVLSILYCSIIFNPLVLTTETDYRYVLSSNSVIVENKKQGTRIWWSDQSDEEPFIEGFSTTFSNMPSSSVIFKISTKLELFNATASLSPQLWIFRMGYYDGYGATLAANISYTATTSKSQPNCLFEVSSRMTDCDNWEESIRWDIPHDAASGIYVAIPVLYIQNMNTEITEIRGSYIPFVVKQSQNSDTARGNKRFKGSDILFKTSDFTWVIYNKYGGWNLYRGNGSYTFDSRAVKASYNRPFQNRQYKPQGQFENFLFGAEYPLLFWLEKHGYDVSYASCGDVEEMGVRGDLVPSNYRILLSIGHDEYYTQSLRDAYKGARDEGINLAFFSSNEIFWRTIWEPQQTILDGLEYVRTAGKGNLSLSYYASEHRRVRKERREGEINVFVAVPLRNDLTAAAADIDIDNSSTVRIFKSNTARSLIKGDLNANKKEVINSTEKRIKIRANRVLYCAKETIEGKANLNSDPQSDWTGTFTDPRFRIPEPELSLTGQKFAVNGFRSDSLEIGEKDSKLRFWRDTDLSLGAAKFPYKTEEGYLGYEWDIFSDDCHKPKGLFTLSSTTKKIKKGLSENFGSSYKGTDVVTHKLSIYRHICTDKGNIEDKVAAKKLMTGTEIAETTIETRATRDAAINQNINQLNTTITNKNSSTNTSTVTDKNADTAVKEESFTDSNPLKSPPPTRKKERNLRSKDTIGNFENVKSSLVFGAGTLQWSWALSTFHDGPYVPENKYLQQATINLFADMDVQPGDLKNEENDVERDVEKGSVKGRDGKYSITNSRIREHRATELRGKDKKALKLAVKSTDFLSPYSVIEFPLNNSVIFIRDIKSSKIVSNSNKGKRKRRLQEGDPIHNNNNNNNSNSNNNKKNNINKQKYKERRDFLSKENNEHRNNQNQNSEKKAFHRNNEDDDRFLMFTGYAVERGGGQVAGVEISMDGGHTWKQTVGGQRWEYKYMVRTHVQYICNLF